MKNSLVTAASLALIGYLLWKDAVAASAALSVAVLLVLLFLRWYEPQLIFYPNMPTRRIERTPAHQGLSFEEIKFQSSDGINLHGWFLPNHSASGNSRTVLFFHGNAGNISHRAERFATFRDVGANLFLFDYRGFGNSTGRPSERGTYLDAEAAYDYLVQQRGLAPVQIVLYGESLGTAVAVDLATKKACGGVVLEAPFTSVPDVAQRMFPFLPVRPLVRNRYDSLSKIFNIHAPLLIFHSRTDEMFSMRHAEKLLNAAPPPKELVELRGGHCDAFLVSADVYVNALRKFLSSLNPVPN